MSEIGIIKIVTKLKEPSQTLSQRVVRGSLWVFSLRISERIFSIQIYDRDPKPCSHDFGVVRNAPLATTSAEISSQTDLQEALIGKF